jgi:hypothetical protein
MFPFGIGFQHYKSEKTFHMKRKGIYEFIVDDETLIKGGNELVWLMWIATELKAKTILQIRPSYERSICLLQSILHTIISSRKVWKISYIYY